MQRASCSFSSKCVCLPLSVCVSLRDRITIRLHRKAPKRFVTVFADLGFLPSRWDRPPDGLCCIVPLVIAFRDPGLLALVARLYVLISIVPTLCDAGGRANWSRMGLRNGRRRGASILAVRKPPIVPHREALTRSADEKEVMKKGTDVDRPRRLPLRLLLPR